ncbi:putative pectinesterase/pectinesterase inhibitor 21 [Vitis vinifera]|uniref:Putative pectinesterase/pectinesterase inhibitor 21 n=1 Tax=Vitis vinifera TaxID=29760 RepID=A0A438BNW1_VITVI|nr:putative pectinesterase/pectinesterase inhibitor 21 [Vitis vinifera]
MLNIMHLAALVASHQKCPKREVILSFPLIFLSVSWSGGGCTVAKPQLAERGINKGTKMIGKAVVSGISLFLVVGVIIGIVSVTRPHGSDRTDGDTNMSSSMKAVASVCATADYKDACMQTLSPVPKNGSSATPKDYIQAAVQVTIKQIKSSMNLSEKLFQATNDSRTQMALGDCKDLLQFAIDELQESFSSVGESDLQTLDQLSTEIMNWSAQCHATYQQRPSYCVRPFSNSHQIQCPTGSQPNSRRLLGEIEVLGHDGYPTWFSATDRKLLALQDNGRLTPNAIVAKDGSGHFTTIAAALAAYPKNLKGRYVIYVKAGIYREYITVTKDHVNVYMYGDGPRKTIVTGTKCYRDGITTYKTATFSAIGKGFVARSMGFVNTAGPDGHQAVALRVQSDMSAFFNCRMDGYQDTLYVQAHRQFYRNCVISGTIDFIFGDSTTVIQNSLIIVRRPNDKQQNTVTAQGKTEKRETTGLPYSKTIIMETTLGDFIQPAGWTPWAGKFVPNTLLYAEYGNLGPGANTHSRVTWKGYRIIKTRNEALQYTVSNVEAQRVGLEERGYTFKRERHAGWIIMRVAEFYLIEGIKQVVPPFDGGLSFHCEVPNGFFFDPELLGHAADARNSRASSGLPRKIERGSEGKNRILSLSHQWGTRIPSHQLSNGLHISKRQDQHKERQPTTGSRAAPTTGDDLKKSGGVGGRRSGQLEPSGSMGEGGVRFVTDELKRGGEVQAQSVKGGNVGFSGGGGCRFEPKPKFVMEMAVLGLAHGSDLGLGLEPSPRIDEEPHCSSN